MSLDEKQLELLKAVVDQIIAPADYPGVYESKLLPRVERYLTEVKPDEAEVFGEALRLVDSESFAVFGGSFLALHRATRDELLDRLESENVRLEWPMPAGEFVQLLVDLIADALGMAEQG